jgi:AcrR family transcriptional regulator
MAPRGERLNARLREASRRRILAAALRLFAQRGFRGTSMAEIARTARVSKGLAYNYFASKDALLEAVLTEWLEGFLAAIPGSPDDETPGLRALIEAWLRDVRERPEHTRLVFSLLLQPEAAEAARRAKLRLRRLAIRHHRQVEDTFRRLGSRHAAGEAAFFGAVMRGITLTALLSPPGTVDLAALAARAERAFLRGAP